MKLIQWYIDLVGIQNINNAFFVLILIGLAAMTISCAVTGAYVGIPVFLIYSQVIVFGLARGLRKQG